MKLFDIIIKELSLVKSQRISMVLLVLYPFLAIGLLGMSFTGFDSTNNINIGLVNQITFESDLSEQFSNIETITVYEYQTVDELQDAVRRKEVLVGLVLSSASENESAKVEMHYDNSNLLASKFFVEVAKTLVQNIVVQNTHAKLNDVWETLSDLTGNIDSEMQNIKDFQTRLDESETELNELEAKLNAIDFSEIESVVDEQGTAVEGLQTETDDFKNDFDEFKESYESVKTSLDEVEPELVGYQDDLTETAAQIDSSIIIIETTITNLEAAKTAIPAEAQQPIQDSINTLNEEKTKLTEWKASINSINASIDSIGDDIDSIDASLAEADALFAQIDSEATGLDAQLSSSSSALSTVDEQLSVFKDSIDEVKLLISDARESKTEIEGKLTESEATLTSLASTMDELGGINPEVLARPVIFYEKKLYDVDPFGALAANATVIVLILTAMLLTSIVMLLEYNQNITTRLELSPTNKGILMLGKIIGHLIIGLVEFTIIFLVALFGFGLEFAAPIWMIYGMVILIDLAFISMGLLVASLTKNQSTAILASLLIIIPLLFLAGIILPVEFMTPQMQFVSSFMPLTAANNILVALIVKGSSIMEMAKDIAILVGLIIIIMAFVLLKKK